MKKKKKCYRKIKEKEEGREKKEKEHLRRRRNFVFLLMTYQPLLVI